ncbi:hypothetical protein COCC4DRAFT_55140 [Bipolaris maydis ATCC 48331]|uniref:Uncharacterized protein n=2 Tax=Cochliobolus heterostrophus TaxID=5016 RepID=M2UAL2_COCH5|nr:uncharacterized protein COCC4DRAFT_55140 [Bipolaris maydis ATCC 48331]EMD95619.1 hypothetical protein COCHEDRAFT_1209912 [Bipolaris maydis C5]ENI10480.1 hypothetical protein COCC4DRAFT_55140 [Bipolaris maydis ATCC 48331]KAJ5065370.1 hypothetical protein J3E74DRAFT_401586 [Bipolaris maydis]
MAGEEFDCRRSVVGPPTLSAAATALIALSTAAMGGLQNFAQPPREPIPGRVRKSSAKVDMVLSEEKKNGGWPRMESEDGMATFGSGQAMERVHLADCGQKQEQEQEQEQDEDGAAEGSVRRDWAYVGTAASVLRLPTPGVDEDGTQQALQTQSALLYKTPQSQSSFPEAAVV